MVSCTFSKSFSTFFVVSFVALVCACPSSFEAIYTTHFDYYIAYDLGCSADYLRVHGLVWKAGMSDQLQRA
jgi:hypothetical protein